MTKRVFGYIFIALSIFLTLAIIASIAALLRTVFGFFKILTGTVDGYGVGHTLGMMTYYILLLLLTITLWNYGKKWIRKA